MREAMTTTLHHVFDAAQSAARDLNQDFVGAEHLLLGLLADRTSEASHALHAKQVDVDDVCARLKKSLPKGERAPVVTGSLPLTPKTQRMLNDAIVKAQTARASAVSTRFLLLSLLEEPGTSIRQAFDHAGADFDELEHALNEKPLTSEP